MSRIFISYARRDAEFVRRLVERLVESGHTVSLDQDFISGGEAWRNRLVEEIDRADVMVVALSRGAVASEHVRREIEIALDRRAPVVPVLVDPVAGLGQLRYHLAGLQRFDLAAEFEAGVAAVLKAVHRAAKRTGTDPYATDPSILKRFNDMWADPQLSTKGKIEKFLELHEEAKADIHDDPSDRRREEIETQMQEIREEIFAIYRQDPRVQPVLEEFNEEIARDEELLPTTAKARLAALRQELHDLRQEQLQMIEKSLKGYDTLLRRVDEFSEKQQRCRGAMSQ
jgi:TIR domain